jgi:protein-tyrosine phosphatase
LNNLNFIYANLLNGQIAIGHKPGKKLPMSQLKSDGITTVVTLLNESEGATAIGQQAAQAGINWIWFPFSASLATSEDNVPEVIKLYQQLNGLLQTGGKIYIHCSAGIHRTGMIAYGLLRFLGYTKEDAFDMLTAMREVTAAQVGSERLNWGDQFALNN